MATHAQQLVYRLLNLMPSSYQRQSLQCLFALFLTAQRLRPRQGKTKSEAALSRFLNRYGWSTRKVIRTARDRIMHRLQTYFESRPGRRPILYAVVDLTCLEKTGNIQGIRRISSPLQP